MAAQGALLCLTHKSSECIKSSIVPQKCILYWRYLKKIEQNNSSGSKVLPCKRGKSNLWEDLGAGELWHIFIMCGKVLPCCLWFYWEISFLSLPSKIWFGTVHNLVDKIMSGLFHVHLFLEKTEFLFNENIYWASSVYKTLFLSCGRGKVPSQFLPLGSFRIQKRENCKNDHSRWWKEIIQMNAECLILP